MNKEKSDFKKEALQKAVEKIAAYLSHRSHSEKELEEKLKSHFTPELRAEALKLAKQKKWIEDPYELAVRVKSQLDNKNKSWGYIKKHLQSKGLPLPDYDREKELEKIKNLLKKKKVVSLNYKENLKLKRFLSYRLFESELISQSLTEFRQGGTAL